MRRWRRGWLILLVGALMGGAACDDNEPIHEESAPPAGKEKVVFVPEPEGSVAALTFRVVYRHDVTSGPQPVTTTETLDVRRPFEARLQIRNGPPPGAEPVSTTVANREYRYELDADDKVVSALSRAPFPPVEIISATAFADAAEAGVIERLGEGTVAGEACVRYAYRQPMEGPLQPATAPDRVESCISPDGILIRRETMQKGKAVDLLEAVEVARSPEQSVRLFLTDEQPEPGVLAGSDDGVVVLPESDAVPDIPVVKNTPDGFDAGSRVAINRAVPGAGFTISYVQGFTRGEQLVVIERLTSPTAFWPAQEGVPLTVTGATNARMVFFPGWVEIRVTPEQGRPARVLTDTKGAAEAMAAVLPVRTVQLPGLDD